MREILLRAWDKEDEEFIYAEPLYGFFPYVGMAFESTKPFYERFVIQQFTGLLDKNGKQIYEGDILGHKKPDEVYYVVIWDTKDDLPNGFNLKATYPQYIFPYIKEIQVIGNIYENPELLKEVK